MSETNTNFPSKIRKTLFLDANASVPPLDEAKRALLDAAEIRGNPSSPHTLGRQSRRVLDAARSAMAHATNAREKEIFFTSGASEGNRWLVDAVIAHADKLSRKPRVWTSPFEHPSLAKPLYFAAQRAQIDLFMAPVSAQGEIYVDPDIIKHVDACFMTSAHNETGIVTPLPTLLELREKYAPHAFVCTDAAQSLARFTDPPDERCDAVVISAQKMGGFAGAGAVVLRNKARVLSPPWSGGGQESNMRPGTESLILIAAMGAAARIIADTRRQIAALATLRDALETKLCAAWPWARILGVGQRRLPNTSALVLDGVDGEALRMAIDVAQICVGFGSACSALAPEPSPALIAMGLNAKQSRSTVRFSLDVTADQTLIDEAIERLLPLVQQLHQRAAAVKPLL